MTRAAIYLRISTRDGRQNLENQRRAIETFCNEQSITIGYDFEDEASGAARRPALESLLSLAKRRPRPFEAVIVWALDRLTRRGPMDAFQIIQGLRASRIELISIQEPHFSTTGPAGELFISIAAWIAQQEHQRMSERIKAGLVRARDEGRRPGPPRRIPRIKPTEPGQTKPYSIRELATYAGVSPSTMARYLRDEPNLKSQP